MDTRLLNSTAMGAVYLLFTITMLVSNIVFAVVLIRGRLVKQRGFLLLLNFAVADVIYVFCLFVGGLTYLIRISFTPLGSSAFDVINGPLLSSVVQVNLVVVNVSYVLETRKEHLNGSRLVAAVMVASPWLYALLVVTPLAASPLGDVQSVGSSGSTRIIGQRLVDTVIPDCFACIATTLAVVSYVTRDRQEGGDFSIEARDATAMDTIAPPQSGSDLDDPPVMTSPAEAPAATVADVTAEPRFPKAEMVYTSVSVGLQQLWICLRFGSFFTTSFPLEMSVLVAAFLTLLRPAVFSWLWLLRPDYEQTFKRVLRCGSQSQPYSTF